MGCTPVQAQDCWTSEATWKERLSNYSPSWAAVPLAKIYGGREMQTIFHTPSRFASVAKRSKCIALSLIIASIRFLNADASGGGISLGIRLSVHRAPSICLSSLGNVSLNETTATEPSVA